MEYIELEAGEDIPGNTLVYYKPEETTAWIWKYEQPPEDYVYLAAIQEPVKKGERGKFSRTGSVVISKEKAEANWG